MNAQDLANLIKTKNEETQRRSSKEVDALVKKFYDEILEVYNNGNGRKYFGCKTVGISLSEIEEYEVTIDSVDDWILAGAESFEGIPQMSTYWDFIDLPESKKPCNSVSGNVCSEIYDLRILVAELEKKGFKCFVDSGNFKLVVVFEI